MNFTEYIVKQHSELKGVIDKYNLIINLDDFGMGTVVFYKGEEVGYWFHSEQGISMMYTVDFGSYEDFHSDYGKLAIGIEKRINELNNNSLTKKGV